MQKTILSKVIAIILLLSLILPTFGTTVIAVVDEVELNQADLKTSTRFVDANMAFIRGDESLQHVVADVGKEDLKFRLYLDLKDEGYFRGGEINILNPEDLTYEFVSPGDDSELVNYVDSQSIVLNQIKGISETFIEIPLRYTGADNVDSKHLLNKNDFELKGEYTNSQGRKYDVYKRTSLALNWTDSKEIEISNAVQKYIKYEVGKEKGIVLQNLVTVSNKEKDVNLPIQKVELSTNLLKINKQLPKTVNVSIQNAKLLNDEENLVLGKDLYKWDEEKNVLNIEVENGKNKDGTYSAGNGNLEVLITTFYDLEKDFSVHNEDMNISVKEFVLTGDSQLAEVQKELKTNIVLDKQIGKIVDITETTETQELIKGLLYVNSLASNLEENLIKSKLKLDISNVEIIDQVKIVENEPQYNNGLKENNLIYKSIEINKRAFTEVFGDGYIEISSGNKYIGKIDSKTKEKNGKLVYDFNDKVSNIVLNSTKPVKEGEVFIEFTRDLNKSTYNISTLKNLKNIKLNRKAYIVLNNEEKLVSNLEHNVKLIDAFSSIVVNTNKTELTTIKKNENVEFVISLNNDKALSDVYGKTVIELVLPNGIKEFTTKSVNLINGNGLKIESSKLTKKGTQYVAQFVLSGTQNGLNKGHLTNGTSIVLNTDITLDQWATNKDVQYNVIYSNSLATQYREPVKWNMSNVFSNFAQFGNGVARGKLKFVAPNGLVLINEFENYNKKNESVLSINQGYQEGKLDILSGKRVIDGSIYLLNNSNSEAVLPSVLGRVPSIDNKNIFTNQSLESTFNTVLARGLSGNTKNATIYYSKNANATNDLQNVSNGWTTNLNLKDIKSYLIVFNGNLPKNALIKFNYGLEVPANLEHNQKVETYSLVEYGVKKGEKISRYYQMASPVGLSTGEGVQLEIDIKSDKEKVIEKEDITYTLSVSNKAKKTDAKNVESYFRIPDNLEFKGIRDDGKQTNARYSKDKSGIYINLGDIKVGSTESKELVFTAKEVKNEEEIDLIVNTAAENFELVKSKKALGSKVEGVKLAVTIEDRQNESVFADSTSLNFYPKKVKYYDVVLENRTGFSFNQATKKATYGETFGKINLSIQLPNTLEYVHEDNLIYKVIEYNRVTNLLKLQIFEDTLNQGNSVGFGLPLRLKENLPNEYNKVIKLAVSASTTGLKTNENISVQSNVVTNYIADAKLNDSIKIYRLSDEKEIALTEIHEYDDIVVKYSLKPTYNVPTTDFIFEASEGMVFKGIYKEMPNGKQSSVLIGGIADKETKKHDYKYPVVIEANKETNLYVHLHIEGIGESVSKTLSYKVGLENAKKAGNLSVKKGSIQNIIKESVEKDGLKLSPTDKKKYGIGAGSASIAKNSILGRTWMDGDNSSSNEAIGRVNVELIDNNSKKVVARTVSNENGQYQFDNVINGDYSVVFKYNENKYMPTAYNVIESGETNSRGIKVNLENQNNRSVAVTDGIQVNFASVRNVDLGLIEKSNFDLSLDAEIIEVEVQNNKKGLKTFNFNNRRNVKLELDRSDLNNSTILVKQIIKVKNEGELEGNVLRIKAEVPKGMNFVPEQNQMWELDEDGSIFTTSLSANVIVPGQTLSVPLTLETEFNKESLGLSVIDIEIAEATNALGLPDRDSTPNNMNTDEDDYVNLELILGLNTGKKIAYTLLMLTTVAVIGSMVFLVLRKINGKEIK